MKKSVHILLLALCSATLLAQQPAATGKSGQPAGKHVPQAKTHPEFNDYNTAYALSGGAAVEKAADEFSAKYPASELKSFLYAKALHEYQTENNKQKMLFVGQKVLQLDPDNTVALVLTATVMADDLGEGAKSGDRQVTEIKKNCSHALETMDASMAAMTNASPEQLQAYKKTLQSLAHSALGIVALKGNEDPEAERELKLAADLNQGQPDPFIWYHLALAQDHQNKYNEALVSINQAVQSAGSNPDLATLAQGELQRLQTLTGGAAATQSKPQPPAPK